MKLLFDHLPPEERIQLIREQHDLSENGPYYRPLTEEEITAKRDEYIENDDKIDTLNEELKVARAQHKKGVTELKEGNRVLKTEIRTKQAQCKGTLFTLFNHETGFAETYNEQGVFITSRRLRPNEKQGNVYQMVPKTGTE